MYGLYGVIGEASRSTTWKDPDTLTFATIIDPVPSTVKSPSNFRSKDQVLMIMGDTGKHISSASRIAHVPQEQELILIQFHEGDPRDPINFSYPQKWAITLLCCAFGGITAAASSSYSISYESMMKDLNCTRLQATLGLSLYAIGFGIVPLISSSFSEECGRRPVYIMSSALFFLAEVMNALAPNIQTVVVSRALQGVFAACGASLIGGSIADIWQPHERGLPMSLFAFSSLFSFGLGSAFGGLISASPHLGWRWVQWVHAIFTGAFVLSVILVMSETRSSIILAQIAKDTRKITGDPRYRSSAEIGQPSMSSLIKTSCTRPLYLLFTEPVVQCFSLWIGFVWGVVYCLFDVGAIIGFLANMYQETLYRKYFPTKGQEARLYMPCVAAVVLPISMLIYAWTASPNIPWIAPLIGLTAFMSGVLVIFQVSCLYLADCYGPYTSSAQAGQSLARTKGNIMALMFPLFTQQMFAGMTYKWGLTLWALLSVVMAPIPWIFFFHGSKIRSRSKVSRKILEAERDGDTTVVSSPTEEKSMQV
ncbi:major facilitator superfamily domain-containing protein [Suillus subaureus]|uniref:Major facilitator superfamily domain-containing protein n=1 Tax=Suillus subaureus TaxID=48587 RepID=A0A9P7DZY0_9AGAM|nr:major facilitator superfamily domain-containing protein [Suillus subaureus]KAG1807051.1 major facilitator superfamily domain-containing protein [Suillus subaureus]